MIYWSLLEGSHSGLVRTLGKRVWGYTHREFESLTLRFYRSKSALTRSATGGWVENILVRKLTPPFAVRPKGFALRLRSGSILPKGLTIKRCAVA